MIYDYHEAVKKHLRSFFGPSLEELHWDRGPIEDLQAGFRVLRFPPSKRLALWTYGTCGMSNLEMKQPIEICLHSAEETANHVELLTAIAHFQQTTRAQLNVGHTVNFGRPWLPNSKCEFGLISLPYLHGPEFERLMIGDNLVRMLWLVPITRTEVDFKAANGLEALESLFENREFDYADPNRPSVA
jgi:hypothetical protein